MATPSPLFDLEELSHRLLPVLSEHAQTTAEYAVILTLITTGVVLAVGVLANSIGVHISDIARLFP